MATQPSAATGCECTLAGYCKRHHVQKHSGWLSLCQNRADYFEAWEKGRGPGQNGSEPVQELTLEILNKLRAMWGELHRYALLRWNNWSEDEARKWFEQWQLRLPITGCGCRKHWRELLRTNPPDFSSAKAFFAWTVWAHNTVNEKLKKPTVTVEEAMQIWSNFCPLSR